MFDDEKIKLIRTMPEGDKIALIWVQILCLAGKINDGGWVYMGQNLAYSDEMLATILDHPLNIMRVAIQTLEQFGMISVKNDGKIDVMNWDKHQSTDKMNKIARQNRERQQRYYYKNRLRELGVNVEAEGFPTGLDELTELLEEAEKPNVSLTLPNGTEVRGKKEEVRSKKLEVNTTKSDFEKLWSLYPNKKSKPRAFTAYKRAIKDGVTNKEIQDGILAYKKEIEIKGTDKQFIKHGGTWFNNQGWEDAYDLEPPKRNYRKRSNYNEIIPEWVNKTDEPMQEEPTENKETIDEEELRRRLDELMGEDDDVQDNG